MNTAYKIFADILRQRLLVYSEPSTGEYQGGFRNDRSTTDELFSIRQIMEKCREFNVVLHHLFVDFETAYDKVFRMKLWNAMVELGYPKKLIDLSRMTLSHVRARIRIRNNLSDIFEAEEGLRQGDGLAALFFNIVLEKVIRESNVETSGTIFRKLSQLLGYADDLDLIGRNVDIVKENFTNIEEKGAEFGFKVSEKKTKYMTTSLSDSRSIDTLEVNGKHFETVDNFIYLGSQVNSDNSIGEEIRRRVTLGNRSYVSLQKLFRSKTLNRNLKCELYRTLVRPVTVYGSEAWCMTQRDEQTLMVFERRILRSIFGGVNVDGCWRRRFNHELNELYKEPHIVKYIKINRLRWLGHVQRMDEKRVPLKLLNTNPDGKRKPGRPKSRWKDAIESDLKVLNVGDWKTLARNRSDWRRMLEEAKTNSRL